MNRITLDPELRARLNGLSDLVEVCDENDKTVGMFVPLDQYKKLLYENVTVPFTKEEIDRFRSEKGACSLAEFWKKMGVT